ncbi:ABC transporter ATP-binding protein [Sporolactobacillus sp. THM19-2]|jgi:ABC-2 type transport system ATP-binding protein|uniref:ABC transporter ATP-binding protein n=1 Tax=Sporolactobacillus sp. THM19-2 TaxID=2511171 RepID=UPI0010219F19|nr:ABC transporter ATP-binding protein [Sporolactobacillus sp. THM19-2]RYL93154.1 ABC transporter ATP-binding protein [Sporolactobacillus sp. THM19-2]
MENILELSQVNKSFKDFALRDVSFSLKKGFIMGFIGPNGAGKSTTIRCIMDLMHIDSGEIRLFGEPMDRNMKGIKDRIGFVYDQDVFFEHLTADKNKKVIAPFYTQWDDQLFYHYIDKFDVPLDKKMKDFSKGTKMKFALAIALSHHAELIIMDEPTSGLDPVFRRELLDVLMEVIQDENKAIFFSTHITTDLEKVADYITFILDGKIAASMETDELLESYLLVKGPKNAASDVLSCKPIAFNKTPLGFEAFMKTATAQSLVSKSNIHLERPNLEEIMYYLVKKEKNKPSLWMGEVN